MAIFERSKFQETQRGQGHVEQAHHVRSLRIVLLSLQQAIRKVSRNHGATAVTVLIHGEEGYIYIICQKQSQNQRANTNKKRDVGVKKINIALQKK
jgi:hypothetical protein